MSDNTDILSIFCKAVEIESITERQDWLNEACGRQADLRRKVDRLIEAHFRGGRILDTPPHAPSLTQASTWREALGTHMGPYKLLQLLGEGGMGVVYLAEQNEPVNRKVALKIIKPGTDSKHVMARFEAERQTLAMMDHVNIARVLDAGTHGNVNASNVDTIEDPLKRSSTPPSVGRPYFVMELINGVPITKYCDDNQLSLRKRLELFVPVCQAIHHAHQKGVIHRDIKPSNVMITIYDGRPVPKIIDFGVAKAIDQRLTERTMFTQHGTMVGTLEYMSPEQAEMNALGVDTRSDIYSLGVLLYELLTGTTPLSHKRLKQVALAEVLRLIKEEEPPKPSTRLSASGSDLVIISAQRQSEPANLTRLMQGELDWIVMKTLEKDRNRRYESASEFAADLQRYLNDEQVLACPPSARYRFKKLVRRYRLQLMSGTLVALALILGIIGTTWAMLNALEARAEADEQARQRQVALNDREAALRKAHDSQRSADEKLFESYLSQAKGIRHSSRPGQRFESLHVLKQATELARLLKLPSGRIDELRCEAISSLALPDLYPYRMFTANTKTFAFDFDGGHNQLAMVDQQGNCTVRRLVDGLDVASIPGLGETAIPFFSEDGRHLAILHIHFEGVVYIGVAAKLWSLESAPPRLILSLPNARRVDFHPAGQHAAFVLNDGSIQMHALTSGQAIGQRLLPDTITREAEIDLHPSKPIVAVCSYFSNLVQLRDLNTQQVIAAIPQTDGVSDVAWHPDGRLLAIASGEGGKIQLYDHTTKRVAQTMQSTQAGLQVSFNHSGDRLVAWGWQQTPELFDVHTGQKLFSAHGQLSHFSSDDRALAGAVSDNQVGIWQVGDGREHRQLRRNARPEIKMLSVAMHRDGRLLAVGMEDGLGFWDAATGRELEMVTLGRPGAQVTDVAFEASGDLLTAGVSGLNRWPVKRDPSADYRILIGPPVRLFPMADQIRQSADGKVLVATSRNVGRWQEFAGTWLWNAVHTTDPIRLEAGSDVRNVAVSPDGRWVVTSTHAEGVAKVWDARDGSLVKQLSESSCFFPSFSGDGRWLSSSAIVGGAIFDTNTWQPIQETRGFGIFSPDSQMITDQTFAGTICLIDRAERRELARLESPDFTGTYKLSFSPDQTKLIGVSEAFDAIRIWDLQLIRQSLHSIGLDWNSPTATTHTPTLTNPTPLEIQIDPGDLGLSITPTHQQIKIEIERCREVIEEHPNATDECNRLAWLYLTGPDSLRDVQAALPLAKQALLAANTPQQKMMARNTIGMAYYRLERFQEAIDSLQPNVTESKDETLAFDLYLLAMCYCRIDNLSRAGDYHAWANRWYALCSSRALMDADQLAELTFLQIEAAQLFEATSSGVR